MVGFRGWDLYGRILTGVRLLAKPEAKNSIFSFHTASYSTLAGERKSK